MTDIIVIKQLPEIEAHLKVLSDAARAKIVDALALECTDENIQAVKKLRADLNREFNSIEERRKEINRQIAERLAPFTDSYKEYITDVYVPADKELKARIAALEDEKKEQKRQEVKAYFEEYAQNHGIDFVDFEAAGINVTLTASLKSLKEQAKAFIDKICDDLALIATQEHNAEILVEYRQSLNVSQAITRVKQRMEAVEAQKRREEELAQQRQAKEAAAQKVEDALPPPVDAPLAPPSPIPPAAASSEDDPIITISFRATHRKSKMRELKKFLIDGGYVYEQDCGR